MVRQSDELVGVARDRAGQFVIISPGDEDDAVKAVLVHLRRPARCLLLGRAWFAFRFREVVGQSPGLLITLHLHAPPRRACRAVSSGTGLARRSPPSVTSPRIGKWA